MRLKCGSGSKSPATSAIALRQKQIRYKTCTLNNNITISSHLILDCSNDIGGISPIHRSRQFAYRSDSEIRRKRHLMEWHV
jgi:hypothetical protein